MGALVRTGRSVGEARDGQADALAVAEAARAPARTLDRWLGSVVEAARLALGDGLGAMGWIVDLRRGPAAIEAISFRATPAGLRRLVLRSTVRDAERTLPLFERGCATLRDHFGPRVGEHPLLADYRRAGQRDSFGIAHVLPEGRAIAIAVAQRSERTTTARERLRWRRVMAHVASGLRAREGRADAILRSDGRVEHAEAEVRADAGLRGALREATLRAERARGRMRREDPDGALEVWSAMVGGEYSLVDQFEHGGRRYVVARRCALPLRGTSGLTSRELVVAAHVASGRSLKLVGYELGLSISTVATHLGRAMRKLEVGSRAELAAVLGPLGVPAGPAPRGTR